MMTEGIPDSGVYILLIRAEGGKNVEVGAWGTLDLEEGYYAYVGRARRGLSARLARHTRREDKRLRWHIDYLLERAELLEAWIYPLRVGECPLARKLVEAGADRDRLEGFGASDCRCAGHLLYLGRRRPSPLGGYTALATGADMRWRSSGEGARRS